MRCPAATGRGFSIRRNETSIQCKILSVQTCSCESSRRSVQGAGNRSGTKKKEFRRLLANIVTQKNKGDRQKRNSTGCQPETYSRHNGGLKSSEKGSPKSRKAIGPICAGEGNDVRQNGGSGKISKGSSAAIGIPLPSGETEMS